MALNDIKARLLREAMEAKGRKIASKPSMLSLIYPVQDYGKCHPHKRIDLGAKPEVDHSTDNKADEKTKVEKDPQGPKDMDLGDPLTSLRASSFTPNHYEHGRRHAFVQRCIDALTGTPTEKLKGMPREPVSEQGSLVKAKFAKKGLESSRNKFKKAVRKFQQSGHG